MVTHTNVRGIYFNNSDRDRKLNAIFTYIIIEIKMYNYIGFRNNIINIHRPFWKQSKRRWCIWVSTYCVCYFIYTSLHKFIREVVELNIVALNMDFHFLSIFLAMHANEFPVKYGGFYLHFGQNMFDLNMKVENYSYILITLLKRNRYAILNIIITQLMSLATSRNNILYINIIWQADRWVL